MTIIDFKPYASISFSSTEVIISVVGGIKSEVSLASKSLATELCLTLSYCENLHSGVVEPINDAYCSKSFVGLEFEYGKMSERKKEIQKTFRELKQKEHCK